ncbi:ATP-binding cassette domain-containing protein [Reichenbachiella carrageenanivorans]|uniref:ATP-binding cassette domain-containing protein n=1 Tax=Reichenbachiella carrageenanivorans TaxID=2979869 RepID=A0ABY6D099_9BACT|nr:ATP-binding cassette domain-containing protein [Reichenbachiella carrageenanivorans]UXX79582.1 ATP-binding cassette domain-containing protein [Reichenbachiella carrageenanivorans]
MSESIINALMRLFAIIESVKDEVVDSGHIIVEPYLEAQLNHDLAEQYLNLYQDYVEFYRREASSSEEELENETKNIIQVTKICQQLNKELLQHERVIVFIQLVELINTDSKVSDKENDFMQLVALNFNLPKQEINDITSFILDPEIKDLSKANGMLIDNKVTEWPEEIAWMMKKKKEPGITDFRHIHVENLFGQIKVLFIQSISTFVIQYDGPLNLYLEGNKITKNKTYILKSGSIIKGSTIEPIYESEISKRFLLDLKKVNLVLHSDEMQFQFKNSSNGIQPFSFYEESGQLIGIMGGSGTGKSTLINLLNGKLEPSEGKIKINGHSIPRCVHAGVIGYVPQDDLLFEELTVYQNLYFNARLSFSDFSKKRLDMAINKVLEDLDIDEIRDLEVGNPLNKFISGGQRKRLNIALELLREPSVLFVDEPTSGLSSMDSEVVMNLLKEQSRKGKLVIAIIHQPSSAIFKLFDKLWLLDKGGYPIYNGNPVDAVVYFKTMNTQVNAAESECRVCGNVIPEQILHIIEAKEINEAGEATKKRKISPAQWYDKYKENIEPKIKKIKYQTALPPSNFLIPNLAEQSNIFLQRILLSKKTNLQYILLNFFEPPLLALILGILSKYSVGQEYIFSENKNIPVFLFMTVVVALFLGLSVSAEEIFKDKKVLERESFLNLSRFSYINSKIFYLFGLSAVQMLFFVWFSNSLLEIQGLTFNFWLILFSTACFANMVGLNISSGLNSIVTIYILIPLILVPQLLLGGAMIKFDELHHNVGDKKHVPLIGDAMVSRWAYEALAVELFSNNKYEKHFFDYDKRMSDASYNFAYLIPKIQTKLKVVYLNIKANNESLALQHEIAICRKELEKMQAKDGNTQFYHLNNLSTDQYDSISHFQTMAQLNLLRKKYKNLKDEAVAERESHYYELVEKIGKDGLLALKNANHNKTLEHLLTNRDEIEKIYEADDELIQKKDPIYMTPDSNLGNAHFYAPVKVLGNIHVDTFYFNIIIIWLMTAFFYMTLYYDMLRKFLAFITNKFTQH